MEDWRSIAGWENYEVSSLGRVRRGSRLLAQTWTGTVGKQYLACNLSDAPRRKTARVHCLVAEAFLGPKPAGFDTAHLDGDRENNSLANLAYVTPSENNLHKRAHGTMSKGEKRHNAILSENVIREIRNRSTLSGAKNVALAREFGVSEQQISKVVNRLAWRHVAG